MRAFFFTILSVLLALATSGTPPAIAASASVTVTNASVYTAVVTVRRDGTDIGRALIHSKRHVTISTPVDPAGASIAIGLTFNGKPICKIATSIPAAVTRWIVIGEAAAPGSIPKCAIRRG